MPPVSTAATPYDVPTGTSATNLASSSPVVRPDILFKFIYFGSTAATPYDVPTGTSATNLASSSLLVIRSGLVFRNGLPHQCALLRAKSRPAVGCALHAPAGAVVRNDRSALEDVSKL